MFIINPILAISLTFKYLNENTTAFGGVAIGSINAAEHTIVTGRAMCINGMFNVSLTTNINGSSVAAAAVLEISSVKKIEKETIIKITTSSGILTKLPRNSPTTRSKPVSLKPVARLNQP